MDVAGDLVHTETTGNVATLVRLILQLVCPAFIHTLFYPIRLGLFGERMRGERTNLSDRIGGVETPASVDIRLADLITCITAAVRIHG